MNYKQLTFAREFRGYSQSELAASISGLSQSNLSKFEKGFGTISEDLQNKIIEFLHFPVAFFDKKICTTIENANYRKKATVSKGVVQKFENKCKLVGYIIDQFSNTIDWPEFKLAPLNVEEGYSPEYVASYNRKMLGISKGEPVANIFTLLESAGIIIYEIDENEKFDAVSFITDNGYPVIIINKNFSNDRKRFTLAHELGHILIHNENNYPISSFREKEKEANNFASEFLMPENEIRNSLRKLKMGDLAGLKRFWLTSMSSLIRRAKDLECIDSNRYTFFNIEMSRSGYSKKEPVEVYIDKPTCFKNGYSLFKEELSYSSDDFVEFISLPKDILNEIFSFDNMVKLKPVKLY